MLKRSLVLIFVMIIGLSASADITTVSGKVINGKGLVIRLMTYSDQVSFLRETLQSELIETDEMFSFAVENYTVKYCWIDIEFQKAEIFIQPGQSYEIEIELKNQSLTTSYYDRGDLPCKFIKDDDDHLNLSIQDFNQLYNDFLLDYAERIKSINARTAYETFIRAIELRFQNADNNYFRNYISYKSASMQLFMRLKGRDNIGIEYFTGQPVLYDHLEYMDFFHLFFEKYFLTGGKYFNYNKTYDLVNGNASAMDIIDSMKADPVLKDFDLRELLLLDGLKELYSVSGFKRERIITLVNEIQTKGNSEEIRKLADNLLKRLKRLQKGSPAPEFTLTGFKDNKEYRLEDFTGKYVYLAFFESVNPACQSELGMISELYEANKEKIAFVAVSVDKDLERLSEYLGKAELPWLILLYGGNLDLLENYDAITYPHFLVISDEGMIVRCPAPSPSENIQKLFDSF